MNRPNPFLSASMTARHVAYLAIALTLLNGAATGRGADSIPQWGRFEATLESSAAYTNPLQQVSLTASFSGPKGEKLAVPGFWDGNKVWRVRFSPSSPGKWTYTTTASDSANTGLHQKTGEFTCSAPQGTNALAQHGPVQVAPDGRYLMHADGTPFFFLGDTAWNGPLLAAPDEWNTYLRERSRQKFNAVQWVTTQWRASPTGDAEKRLAFSGHEAIEVNPAFFQRLDQYVDAMNNAGLVSVPVLLWAIGGGSNPRINPGFALPESQAILLARYMVARWGAHDVIWILGGDGDYRGERAERWRKIGRGVFNDIAHAPVVMHPGGMQWVWNEFKDEKWLGIFGYQSGHGDDEKTLRWLSSPPLTEDWTKFPHRPVINLEPPYENHVAYQSKTPITPEIVRRAVYWSLLNVPTAGVTYGGHGVWGWDDGTKPPTDHPTTGTPMAWDKALKMPGAEQMKHVYDFFTSIDFWRLRPASIVVVDQPGSAVAARFVAAARTDKKDILIVYTPEDRTLTIKLDALPPSPAVTWVNPRTGEKSPAVAVVTANTVQFPTPAEGDWILFMQTSKDQVGDNGEKKEPAPAPTPKP